MKTTAVIWFSLFCFGINLQQGFGQCAPQLFFRDDDGDGHGIGTQTEINNVYADYYASGNKGAPVLHSNVYMGCNPPAGWSKENNDLDDTNRLITNISPQNFYLDRDGDGFGSTSPFVYQRVMYQTCGFLKAVFLNH